MGTHWKHWKEDLVEDGDKHIPYYAGTTFLKTQVADEDTFSVQAAQWFDIDIFPFVETDLDMSMVRFSTVQRPKSVPTTEITFYTDDRGQMVLNSGFPPPECPFDHVGDPVYVGENYVQKIHELGWDNGPWATYFDKAGNRFGVRQSGTDRYWCNTAEGGASVPALGENVFWESHASESGNYSDVNHWRASVGTAGSGAYVCTMDIDSANLGTVTMSYASATLAVVSFTLQHSGAGSQTAGTISFTTGLWQADGGMTISGTFGSNTAYRIDAVNWIMSGSPTFVSPTGAGTMTVSGNLTGTTTMSWTQSGVTTVLDGATQTLTGFTNNSATTVLGNITFQTSTTLTCSGQNRIGTTGQSVVLTFNMTGAIANASSANFVLRSTNTNPIICTAMPTSFNSNLFQFVVLANCNLPTATWTAVEFNILCQVASTITATGNITITGTNFNIWDNVSGANPVLAIAATTFDCSGVSGTFTCGTSNRGGAITATTGTIKIGGTLTNTGDTAFTFGSNSNYVLDLNGSLNYTVGTINLPNATGTATAACTTWNQGTATVNANSGLVTFDKAGTTTLGSNATSFYSVTISNGTTLDTSAASSFALTCAYQLSVGSGISGVLTANASTLTLAAVTVNDGGLYSNMTATSNISGNLIVGAGVSGSMTFTTGSLAASGTVVVNAGAAFGSNTAWTFTQNSTLNSAGTYNAPTGATWTAKGNITLTSTFNADNGTCTCTTNSFYISENAAGSFYNIIINANTKTINVEDFSLSVSNNLTVTAGAFTTLDSDAVTSRDLSVTMFTDVTGVLTCNASNISLGAGLATEFSYGLNVSAGGTFTGGTGPHTIGTMAHVATGNITLTSNTTTVNGRISGGSNVCMNLVAANFAHNNGTLNFTYAGSQYLRETASAAVAFNNMTVTKGAGNVLQYANGRGFFLTVANTLTITTGTFDTSDVTSGTSRDLTISGASSVTGSLLCNHSTVSAAAVTVNDGGLWSNMTATTTMSGNLIVGGGASGSVTTGASTFHLNGTTTINAGATLGTAATTYTLDMNGNLLASAGTLIAPNVGTITFGALIWNTPAVFTASNGSVNFDSGGTCALANDSVQFYNVHILSGSRLNSSTYAFTTANNMSVGTLAGVQSWFYTTSGIKTIGGDLTINSASSTFGTDATAYNLVLTGNLAVSDGRLFAPTAAGSFTMAGATWNTPTGEFRHESGTVQFIRVGITSFGNSSTGFHGITVNNGTTLTTTGTNYDLTAVGDVTVSGILTTNASPVSMEDITITATGTYNATTGITYITGADGANVAWDNENTFNNNGGSVVFLGHLSPFIIMGDNLWNVLEIVVADGPTYLFEGNHTQTVQTYCHINGNSTDALTIDSTDANDWFLTLNVGCTQDFAYLTVDQSDASGGLTCVAAFSTDMLTNTNWVFGGPGVFIWDGGGPNNLASNRFNWTGDITPGATADCFFTIASNKACTWDIASNSGHIQVDINYSNAITMNNGVTWSTLDIANGTWATNGQTIGILGQLTASDTSAITATAASRISTGSHLNISGTATVGNNLGYDLLMAGDLNQSGGDFYAPSSTGTFEMSGDFWNRTGGTWHNDSGTVQFTTIATTSPTAAETFWGVSIAGTATFDTTIANFGITILQDLANAGALTMNGSILTLGTTTHTTIFTNTGVVTVGTSTMRILDQCSAVLDNVPEFTVISFEGPAGWLYSHDHDGVANDDHYFGEMNTSDAPAGYRAINWTDAHLHIREADVYTNPFPTKITLDEVGASWVQKILYPATQFLIDPGASMA